MNNFLNVVPLKMHQFLLCEKPFWIEFLCQTCVKSVLFKPSTPASIVITMLDSFWQHKRYRLEKLHFSRQGSYKLIETDEQWQSVQRQRGGGYQGQQQRSRSQGDKGRSQSNQYLHPHYQRRSGYLNSGAETESEVVTANSSSIHQPQAVVKRTRRRR